MSQGEAIVSRIKEELVILVALQECEKQISSIENELTKVDARVDALNEQLAEYENQVTDGQTALEEMKQLYRSGEDDVKVAESQIIKSQEKLRAVKTNKEYQSTLKEIDDFKQKSSQIEDDMLAILDKIEAVEAQMAQSTADLSVVKVDVESQRGEICAQAEEQKKRLAGYQDERTAILGRITPVLIDKYKKVKRQGRGVAIAAVEDAVCQVCRMNIPPQLFNDLLRMDTMRMCPNCQRIIYPVVALQDG